MCTHSKSCWVVVSTKITLYEKALVFFFEKFSRRNFFFEENILKNNTCVASVHWWCYSLLLPLMRQTKWLRYTRASSESEVTWNVNWFANLNEKRLKILRKFYRQSLFSVVFHLIILKSVINCETMSAVTNQWRCSVKNRCILTE